LLYLRCSDRGKFMGIDNLTIKGLSLMIYGLIKISNDPKSWIGNHCNIMEM
jgi:hypothetical protein